MTKITIPVKSTGSELAATEWEDLMNAVRDGSIDLDTAIVFVADGTAGAPSITFSSDTDTGFYLSSTGQVSYTSGGIERVRFDNSGRFIPLGPVFGSSGSAGSPSYSFLSDTNSGLFSAAADTIGFSTSGSERLRIDSSGNVGLGGTPAAGQTLLVQASAGPVIDLVRTSNRFTIQSDETNMTIGARDSGGILFQYGSASEGMRLDSTGKLGIGTSAPNSNVHIKSSASWEPHLQLENTNADANPPYFSFYKNSASPAANDNIFQLLGYANDSIGSKTNFAGLVFTTPNVTNGSEQGQINFNLIDAGVSGTTLSLVGSQVGIGTSSPDGALHVMTASAGVVSPSVNNDDLVIENSGAGGISILVPNASAGGIVIGSPSDNNHASFTATYNGNEAVLRTGKVGSTLKLHGDNDVLNLSLSGSSGNELATFSGSATVSGSLTANNGYVRIFKSASDSYISLGDNSINFSLGIDNGTGEFEIAPSSDLTGLPALSIDTSSNATFAAAVELSSGSHLYFDGATHNYSIRETGGDLQFKLNGGVFWQMLAGGQLYPGSATRPSLLYSAASATVPNIVPHRDDTNTGLGGNGADTLSLIAGGKEMLSLKETGVSTTDQVIIGPAGIIGSATSPALAFGDGDSGFYESVDDTINVAILGVSKWAISANIFGEGSIGSQTANRAQLIGTNTTSTIPNIVPDATDTNTGIGQASADQLSLIAGGVEGVNITEVAGVATVSVGSGPLALSKFAGWDTEVDNGNSGVADTIDFGTGNLQKSTLTGNVTYTFTAPPNKGTVILRVVQDATGGRTIAWPASVRWAGGVAPTPTSTASSVDVYLFVYDGTNYDGDVLQDFS